MCVRVYDGKGGHVTRVRVVYSGLLEHCAMLNVYLLAVVLGVFELNDVLF